MLSKQCAVIKKKGDEETPERNMEKKEKKSWMLMNIRCWLYSRMPTHTCYRLTNFVLTSFSIALTSSAALGTSVEPWREASNAEDCKSPARA